MGLNTTLNATANSAALQFERPHIFVGVYTTSADAGSALGPLLAYSLGVVLNLNVLYILTAGLVLVVILIYVRLASSTARPQTADGRPRSVMIRGWYGR